MSIIVKAYSSERKTRTSVRKYVVPDYRSITLCVSITGWIEFHSSQCSKRYGCLSITYVLPFSEDTYSGANVLIKGIDSPSYMPIPLHRVYLITDLVSGPVVMIGLKSSLPFNGIQLSWEMTWPGIR